MEKFTALAHNFTLENIAILLLSIILYFLTEFKTKWGKSDFSILIWWKDNWYNILINVVAILLFFLYSDAVTKMEALAIGLVPNWAIDALMDLKDKLKGKKRMKIAELIPVFVEEIPTIKEAGKIYISEKYKTSSHLCACGCRELTVLPFNQPGEWTMTNNNGKITFSPSIGNFSGEAPYHAHYFIRENKIVWS